MNNLEHAIEILENEHDPNMGPIDAPSLAYALNDAGLLAGGEYMELAPKHRYAVARTKEHIIISDNEDRTTLYVPLHHVNDLVHGLLLAQAHEGNNGGATP